MRSGWGLWQNPDFLEVYAKGRDWTVDEVNGVWVLVSSKRLWSKRATVNGDEVNEPQRIWEKYPNAIIKTYTPLPGFTSAAVNQGTYLINLRDNYREAFNKPCRGCIRRSLESKQQVTVAETEVQLREWYQLYKRAGDQMKFKTQPYRLVKLLFDSQYSQLYTTHLNGELASGLFVLLDDEVAMEWIGATDRRFSKECPNYRIHHEAFSALQDKVKVYDFGGVVKDTGIDHFKQGFGGTYAPLCLYRRPQL